MKRVILFVMMFGIGYMVADAFADNHKQSNFMRYDVDTHELEVFVFRKGEPKVVGTVDFPTRYSAIKTSETILSKSATKEELEYFCGWAIQEKSE